MSCVLRHIYSLLRVYCDTYRAGSLHRTLARRIFDFHPFFCLRILARFVGWNLWLAFRRSLHYHGSRDPHQRGRGYRSRSRQQPTSRIYQRLLVSILDKRPFTDACLVYHSSTLVGELWQSERNRTRPFPGQKARQSMAHREKGSVFNRLFWHLLGTHHQNSPIDPLLLVLGLTQTCFEGSMYLFVFLWVPSLQERASQPSLPLGYIFSSFMISMMLGSLLYTTIVSHHQSTSNKPGTDASLTLHGKMSSLVCAGSALSLATSIASNDERYRFWSFCVFEACVGMYYPIQGTLRGMLISNEHRATVRLS